MKKILVMEDEENIRSFVVINLRRSGYEPIEAATGAEALEKIKVNQDICIALLDVMLPDIDGFEVCRRIRAQGSKMGVIMLTAKSQEIDKVTGLMNGADDYITKPFSPAELTARPPARLPRQYAGADARHGLVVPRTVRARRLSSDQRVAGLSPGRLYERRAADFRLRSEPRGGRLPPALGAHAVEPQVVRSRRSRLLARRRSPAGQ